MTPPLTRHRAPLTADGASGAAIGVAVSALLHMPRPAAFTAAIRTEYSVPLVRPLIVPPSDKGAFTQSLVAVLTCATYNVTAEPPSFVGGFQDSVRELSSPVADTRFGAVGYPIGVAGWLDAAGPVPAAFTAAT